MRKRISGRASPNMWPGTIPGSTAIPRPISPSPVSSKMFERLKIFHEQAFVDNVTQGLWAADLKIKVDDEQVEDGRSSSARLIMPAAAWWSWTWWKMAE